MNTAVLDYLVTGFESLDAGLSDLPDADDRHVPAAVTHCGAQESVRFNERDFPDAVLRPYGIRAVHPGVFAEHLPDLNSEAVCEAIKPSGSMLPRTAWTCIPLSAMSFLRSEP